ncbi:protein EXECUTER 2, chloroplastic isoform X2 [Canna indica]|uniref:Protein EXECUTER 2, chloroplastic isoform X2 n=1 Tax=Canna indica TaxID=4628 RepID=A0AAQ3K856_9LILI|nr:protein EXECUTER 2, chloroplastic isoform X2 [Canna indica]
MSMANSWAAASAPPPPGPLSRSSRLDPPSREARHLCLAVPSPRRPVLRSHRGPPGLSCGRGDFIPNNTSTGGGGIYSEWDWNRWSQHFSETDQSESLCSLLKVSATLDCHSGYLLPRLVHFQ